MCRIASSNARRYWCHGNIFNMTRVPFSTGRDFVNTSTPLFHRSKLNILSSRNFTVARSLMSNAEPTIGHTSSKRHYFKGILVRLGIAGGLIFLYTNNITVRDTIMYGFSPLSLWLADNASDDATRQEEREGQSIYSSDSILDPSLPLSRARRELQAAEEDLARVHYDQELNREEDKSRKISESLNPRSDLLSDSGASDNGKPELQGNDDETALQAGAFNEETGEINWDCPCLGGMAYGPCGEQFRAAFSCFVFSKEEQKGIECVDKFKDMQSCFQLHPDVYGDELDDSEENDSASNDLGNGDDTESYTDKQESNSSAP